MKTVLLRSGYAMPMIGFGTWTLRGEACAEAVKTALLTGYRLIDTAQMYRNEDAVGEGIRRAGIPREELFLTTKVCAPADSYEGTKEQISRSLALLGTDYIDLFLIHEPYRAAPAMWRAMTEARAEGKLRALGVSNFSARELAAFIKETGEVPAVDQAESHVFCTRFSLRDTCAAEGAVMQAWSPFAEGKSHIFTDPVLLSVAGKHGKTAAQTALRYLLQLGIPAVPKSARPERMKENLAVFDFSLDAEDMAAIKKLDTGRSLFGWYD